MDETRCAYPGCTNGYKTHRWNDIKAHDAGWFQQKDGRSWCPEHIPDWVVQWRSNKQQTLRHDKEG